ncbi:MAG: urea ABC transporter permease subunit UrtB [Oxalicibacterium faecigallinarum]|uniref:urea ABC transporter permease subunit UrtB n=1 Tax=Oxalicibacterium faecigallinarum TaxID=573741 RepID=UPI002806EF52|nr:urea ABC transporter permease subunit UrtB [Oxalicibacterium faecigallinarum]MDQ7970456.1 urea ABC transporter permease subunit UrtB [Oxalicibacterium faecigallinarum]
MTRFSRIFSQAWLVALLCLSAVTAHAAIDRALLEPLGGDDPDARIEAVGLIAALANADARKVLDALNRETLYVTPAGDVLVVGDSDAWNPATDETIAIPDDAEDISVNNRLRGVLQGALSGMRLFSDDRSERIAAARSMLRNADPAQLPLVDKALAKEDDAQVIDLLYQVRAIANLHSENASERKEALIALRSTTDASLMATFKQMAEKSGDGSYAEPDAGVRAEAAKTMAALQNHLRVTDFAGKVFYGLSLGSVLLLAALGLAITFGLMGIINMAHGEMLMIGAYTTYVCQLIFRNYFPDAIDAYLVVALPAAFIVTAAVGIVIERLVIRWLYGRPLETLLCTWGISLMLMQTVRSIFGAQNVEVANPSWMSGGFTVLGSLSLSWNRIVIIAFSLLVVLAVWLILNKTRLGLFVRAVTQNRRMADCVGVSTGRVDMMTFGLGCGIAGLGGVALSQLGNVGPDLGQAYIVDSFMVVVLGGVGQLAGTVIAAFGLGEVNKFLEPVAGAVLAKIAILVVIIIFIQKRPQGLFALKGRSVE